MGSPHLCQLPPGVDRTVDADGHDESRHVGLALL